MSHKTWTILIVDARPEDRARYRQYLERDSDGAYDMVEAATRAEGVAVCQSSRIDCILLSDTLADGDGLACLRALRQTVPGGPFPMAIVMLLSAGKEVVAEQAMQQGAQECLAKSTMTAATLQRTLRRMKSKVAALQAMVSQDYPLLQLARFDPLTGLYHQRHFLECLLQEIRRAGRYRSPLCVLLMDLDHDAQVNLAYGRAVGDQALATVGRLLRNSMRSMDLLGYLGGAAFCVALPHTDLNGARVVAERLQRDIVPGCLPTLEHGLSPLTCSIGMAQFEEGMQDTADLLRLAHQALADAKAAGGNRLVVNAAEKHQLRLSLEEQHHQLARAHAELLRKNAEIQRFYHELSHELKTPLTAAREFISIVLDGLTGPLSEAQYDCLVVARESCDQMRLSLNDLLDVTRIDTGKLRIVPQPTGIDEVVARGVAAMRLAAQEAGVDILQHIESGLPPVLIDPQRLIQVLTNLLGNALKFTQAGGQVMVSVQHDSRCPEQILVAVRDTGRGMTPAQCSRIFDRLAQVDHDDAGSKAGLGLGLYICRELITLHGGEIWVESTPQQGSTFFFTLPQCSSNSQQPKKQEEVIA